MTGTSRALCAISQRVRRDAALTPLLWQKQVYVYSGAIEGMRPEPVTPTAGNVAVWRLDARN